MTYIKSLQSNFNGKQLLIMKTTNNICDSLRESPATVGNSNLAPNHLKKNHLFLTKNFNNFEINLFR